MITDRLNHIVSPIAVPGVGGKYRDPAFLTDIVRCSDATKITTVDGGRTPPATGIEYSTMSAINANNSAFLLACFTVFELRTLPDLKRIQLPLDISTDTEPRWSRTDPQKFYYHRGNSLFEFNITTKLPTLIRTFTEYTTVGFGGGESDISPDGNYLVMDGNKKSEIFTFNLTTKTKNPVLQVSGIDAAVLTPRNEVILSWKTNGTGRRQGMELYDNAMNFIRQIMSINTHKFVMLDTDGSEVIICSPDQPGIQKVNINTSQATLLLDIGWHEPFIAGHIAGTIDATDPYVLVSTYDNGDGTKVVYPFQNEIFQVFLERRNRPVQRWAHNRANPSSPYGNQPHLTMSKDGSILIFNSNMGGQTDAYMFVISTPPIPVPLPVVKLALTGQLKDNLGNTYNISIAQN